MKKFLIILNDGIFVVLEATSISEAVAEAGGEEEVAAIVQLKN